MARSSSAVEKLALLSPPWERSALASSEALGDPFAEPSARFVQQGIVDLLDESYSLRLSNPSKSYELALRGAVAARRLGRQPGAGGRALWAASLAFLANALRIREQGRLALRCLRQGDRVCRSLPVAEQAGIPALLAYVEGTLLADYRHFPEAEGLLATAAGLYLGLGAERLASQVSISRARVLYEHGDAAAAIEELLGAGALPAGGHELSVELIIDHLLVMCLTDLNKIDRSSLYFGTFEWMYTAVGNELLTLRGLWLKGRLALRCGEPEGAASLLQEVRDGFASRGLAYDAALAGLDLALAFARIGRDDEVMRVAEEMVPIFNDQGIELEARTAMLQWVSAARRKQLGEEVIRQTMDALTEIRRRPLPLER